MKMGHSENISCDNDWASTQPKDLSVERIHKTERIHLFDSSIIEGELTADASWKYCGPSATNFHWTELCLPKKC